ncbi:hemicentin-1-like [Montipora capricornis]|uniref:hemicentin-1-like n=1 Tax=Montipora capricornis TaxID=246305 RepID=UPI0035F1BF43
MKYIVRISARNIVGYGQFTVKEASTKQIQVPNITWSKQGNEEWKHTESVLLLKNISRYHDGEYRCTATNRAGNATASIRVTVQFSPTITYISHDTTVNETDDVTLFCNASGKPDPTVTWSFAENHAKRMAVTNETILLRTASKDVAGRYRCTSENGVGNPAVAEVQVAINYKPEIKNKSSSHVVSWINHKTVITCTADGFPVPEITWSHNGVVQSSAVKTSAQSRTRHSTLTFTPQEAKDFGVYTCMARNFLGTDKTETTVGELDAPKAPEVFRIETGTNKLEIQWKKLATIPHYPILYYLLQIRKKRGSYSWMNCTQITTKEDSLIGVINNLEANMKYIVRISARNIVGYGQFTVKEASTKQIQVPNITWSKQGNEEWKHTESVLLLKNISRYHDGEYRCTATNRAGNATASIRVTVQYKPIRTNVTYAVKGDVVLVKDTVTFSCSADSLPPPQLELRFNNKTLGLFQNGKFSLQHVNISDEGVYECIARNVLGTGAIARLNLRVKVSPTITYISHDTTVNETDDVTLFCNASGKPDPTVTWSFAENHAKRMAVTNETILLRTAIPNITWSKQGNEEWKHTESVLLLKNISRYHDGEYRCTATNRAGNATASIRVTVQYKPIRTNVTYAVKGDVVLVKDTVTFSCSADSLPPPQLELRFNNKTLGLFQNGKFSLQHVNISDEGVYECIARNVLGTGAIARLNLRVKVSPTITYISHDTTVNETDDVTLFCNASGKPDPTVTWSFAENHAKRMAVTNETILLRTAIPNITWSKQGNEEWKHTESVLLLKNISRYHDGEYRCTATNRAGNATASIRVTVQYKPIRTNVTYAVKGDVVLVKDTVTFSCSADSLPPPQLELRFNNKTLGLFQNGKFSLQHVNISDEGVYECIARNVLGTGAIARLNLRVKVSPTITYISHDTTVNETDDVTLFCNASGKPDPTVTWSFAENHAKRMAVTNETILLRTAIPNITWSKQGNEEWKHTESVLLLKNISRYHDGEYRCTATNRAGNATASIRVTVQYKPIRTNVTYAVKGDVVLVKDTVTFSCSADSLPPPQLELRFNNKTLGLFQNGKFSLQHVNISDEGVYECIARNVLGTGAIARLNLRVKVSPTITYISHDTTVNETDDVTLFCNASGKPDPTVTWSFAENHAKRMAVTNETILLRTAIPNITWSKQGNEEWKHTESVLLLKNISRYHDGEYRCTATNRAGNATASIRVTVQYKPIRTNVTYAVKGDVVLVKDTVTFSCSADSLPPPQLELRFNNKTLGLFQNGKFSLQHVNISDEGVYECIARNVLGTGAIARLNLRVKVSPTITYISHDTTVNEMDDVTLFCNASGKPDPTVTWSFAENHAKRMAVTNETILLRRASKDVAGRYRCTSENGVGNPAVAEVQVAINYKPEIKNKSSSHVVSWINHKTVITCTADGFPVPEITWSHNGVVQSSAVKTSAQSRTRHSTLTFTPQEAKDFGVYTCMARNFLGTDKTETTVGELDAPKAPEVFRIETGTNKLEIQWKKLATIPHYPILYYLLQIRKKRGSYSWMNCTQITTKEDSLIGVINNLEANMKYIVRISARNIVGYGQFTVKEASTKQIQGKNKQPVVPRHMIKWIIVGVAGLVIVMVAIVLAAYKGLSRRRGFSSIILFRVTQTSCNASK